MASTYVIQHVFFKRQTGIENHTKQLDGFSEVNDLPIHYATFIGLQWWLRVVYSWAPPLLSVLVEKNCPVLGQNFTVLGITRGLTLNLSFITPKRHILAWFLVSWVIACKNPSAGLTCTRVLNKAQNVIFYPFAHNPPVDGFVPNLG